MSRASWVILAIAAFPAALAAQDSGPIPWGNKFFVPKDPPPLVVHDFGTVPWGTTLTHRFVVTNIYAVPMQIMRDPQPGCSCTRIVRYTQKLEPRETGFIDIEMDGRRFQGAKTVTIEVEFGPKYRSTAKLQVRASTRGDVTVNPGQLSFGVVALGQEPKQALDVQYSGQQQNWQITGVDAGNCPSVSVSVVRLASSRTSYRLTAAIKPNASPGVMQEQIVLKTNDPNSPSLTVPISGMIQSPLAVVQGNEVRLEPVQVGQSTVKMVMIRANKPFQIAKVEGEGEGLSVRYDGVALPIQRLTLTFKPTQPGNLQRKLTIYTDQKEMATFTVEGTAEIGAP